MTYEDIIEKIKNGESVKNINWNEVSTEDRAKVGSYLDDSTIRYYTAEIESLKKYIEDVKKMLLRFPEEEKMTKEEKELKGEIEEDIEKCEEELKRYIDSLSAAVAKLEQKIQTGQTFAAMLKNDVYLPGEGNFNDATPAPQNPPKRAVNAPGE